MSIIDTLIRNAESLTEDPLYVFHSPKSDSHDILTFKTLLDESARFACRILDRCDVGDRVILPFDTRPDCIVAFWGCLISGVIPVPVRPMKTEAKFAALQSIAQDCSAEAMLLPSEEHGALEDLSGGATSTDTVNILKISDLMQGEYDIPPDPKNEDQIALLQYTSGSTGSPRGVIVTHENLRHMMHHTTMQFIGDSRPVSLSWLPLFHDMGLISHLLHPAIEGYKQILMRPADMIRNPANWLRAMDEHRATVSGSPSFGYALCVNNTSIDQLLDLDLTDWTVAYNGSELINVDVMRAFAQKFACVGFKLESFYPCYGLAESTLTVSVSRGFDESTTLSRSEILLPADHPLHTTIDEDRAFTETCCCGEPVIAGGVEIVDSETCCKVPEGTPGEVWVSNPLVALGYWNRPELTQERFKARIAENNDSREFLRTRDLGFLKGGRLYVLGRIDDIIIFRGKNYFPEDIERLVIKLDDSPMPNTCAAFRIAGKFGDELGVVVAMRSEPAQGYAHWSRELRTTLARSIGIVPTIIAVTDFRHFPRTSSGKLRRAECRRQLTSGELPLEFEWNLARDISQYVGDIDLGRRIQAIVAMLASDKEIGYETNFLDAGLDSLSLAILGEVLETVCGISVDLPTILELGSVERIVEHVKTTEARAIL